MGRLTGQPIQENKWTGDRHFTTSSVSLKKDAARAALDSPKPTPTLPAMTSNAPWVSNFGLQRGATPTSTTTPRPVFNPVSSYTYKPSSSIPQRQPSTSEFYMPRSNSDLLVGTMDQRDPYAMETPLNIARDNPLPPPPPLLSGGRLGAIIVLLVFCPRVHTRGLLVGHWQMTNEFDTACWEVFCSPSWTPPSSQPLWSRLRQTSTTSRTCTGWSWPTCSPISVSTWSPSRTSPL